MSQRAPIALFAFNRPAHAARCLEALSACAGASDSDLVAYLDGPRRDDDECKVAAVAALLAQPLPFRSVAVHRSATNKGLFRSLTEGVSSTLAKHDSVIVVEDDLVVAPDFLDYMAFALEAYRDEPRVGSAHAWAFPLQGLPDLYFLPGADCWGWCTWRDRWRLFRDDPLALIAELKGRKLLDAYMGSHGAASLELLCDRAEGRNQSWAILWHASLFLAGRLTLHPGSSRVENIGNDGSGTHGGQTVRFDSGGGPARRPQKIPVGEDAVVARRIAAFMDGVTSAGPGGRLAWWLKRRQARRRALRMGLPAGLSSGLSP